MSVSIKPLLLPPAARRFAPFGTTIFSEMTALANKHGAINLSQGFPDFDGPAFIRQAAVAAIESGQNQYARSMGLPELVEAVAAKTKRLYGMNIDPMTQVGVYSGATEGLVAAIMGIVNPGDEVVLIEPFYDSYRACVAMAGGVARFCSLRLPDFTLDPDELAACFNNKTRLVVVNTPHNPTGRVFTRAELELIGGLCHKWGAYVLTDEVYEHLVFDANMHVPMASLPGMFDRTLTLSSTGKTFSLTGWKIGYAYGPEPLVMAAQAAHQFLTFSTARPFQKAMAEAISVDDSYYSTLLSEYGARRDLLVGALQSAGLDVKVPQGTYFAIVDVTSAGFETDLAFTRHLIEEVGIACIPVSAFYSKAMDEGSKLARFAFCKKTETLLAAAERLTRL